MKFVRPFADFTNMPERAEVLIVGEVLLHHAELLQFRTAFPELLEIILFGYEKDLSELGGLS